MKTKFRGKRKDNGEWVYGYYFKCWEQAYILWGMTNGVPNMVEVDPSTVGMFTGLSPNLVEDDKEVYQGDIVLITDHTIRERFEKDGIICYELMTKYEVFWNKTKWSIRLDYDIYKPFPFEAPVFDLPTHHVTYEVIGNIYENKEERYENHCDD